MNSHELIGKVVTVYLKQKASENDKDGGTNRYLLDCLTPLEMASIAKEILADKELALKVDIKLPHHYLENCDLPNEILTTERTTYFRNANCQKAILLLATTGDDEQQSLKDITPIGADQLLTELQTWIECLVNEEVMSKTIQEHWLKALLGLCDVKNYSLERLASYLIATTNAVIKEGYPINEALGYALPELKLPRDKHCFTSLDEKTSNHRTKWKSLYNKVIKKRACYLVKQTPTQSLLTDDTLKLAFEKVREHIPEEHHSAIDCFIKAESGWNDASHSLSCCEWEDIKPLFDGLRPEKYNLGKETQAFYDEDEPELLTDDERRYLSNLKKRKSYTHSNDDDEEFYENHRQELKEDIKLKSKWDKFVFGAPVECDDLLVGFTLCLESLFIDNSNEADRKLTVRSDRRLKKDLRKMNHKAGKYFAKKYKGLDRLFGSKVDFDFGELMDFENILESWKKKKGFKLNRSVAKDALRIKFTFELEVIDITGNSQIYKKQLIWKFNPNAITSEMPDDISRLTGRGIVFSEATRETISGKGTVQTLDLKDCNSLHACFAQNKGSLIPKYSAKNDIFLNWEASLEKIHKNQIISDDTVEDLKKIWVIFKNDYTLALSEFNEVGINSQSLINQCKSYSNLLQFICLKAPGDTNRNELLRPLLKIGASQIHGGQQAVIIAPWHPLRLFAIANKAKQIAQLLKKLLSKNGAIIEDARFYFKELKKDLEHPYYPEIVLGWKDNKILAHTDSYLDYSLYELPFINEEEYNDTNEDPTETTKVVTELLKRFLTLYPHEKANLSIVLYNCASSRLPQSIVAQVANFHEDDEDMRCEVILRHRNNKKLCDMYEKIIETDETDVDAYIASEATSDFMARLRIGIMADQAPTPKEEDGLPADIVFLQDVIARHAKLEWYQEQVVVLPAIEYVPTRYSKKKLSRSDDLKSIVYLVSPVQCQESLMYITAIATFFKGDHNCNDGYCFLPARQLDFADTKTRSIFEEIHQIGNWVVNYDELLDRRQLINQGVRVIKHKQSSTQGRNLVISSKAPVGLLKSMLCSRLSDLNLKAEPSVLNKLAEKFIQDANKVSGDLVLRAAKRGKSASELIGVVLSQYLIANEIKGETFGWYFLDDYAEWLGQKEEQIADILALVPSLEKNGDLSLTIIISEVKYINRDSLSAKKKESRKQLLDSVNRINNTIFGEPERMDRSLWLSRFADLVVNGVNFSANNPLDLATWRKAIYNGDCKFYVRGYSHVFISGPVDTDECSECSLLGANTNCYQEIFSRAKLNKLIKLYQNDKTPLAFRRENSDINIWEDIKFKKIVNDEPETFIKPELESETVTKTLNDNQNTKLVSLEAKHNSPEINNVNIISPQQLDFPMFTSNLTNRNDQETKDDLEWFQNVKAICKTALQNFHLRSKLIDDESRLTPNCALLKFQGSSELTVAKVMKHQQEFLTSYGLNITSIVPEAGRISISIERKNRKILLFENVWQQWRADKAPIKYGLELLVGIQEEDSKLLTMSPFSNAPHSLIAGSTGSGKSVLMQNFLLSIAGTNDPKFAQIVLIDPKMGIDYFAFEELPHLRNNKIIIDQEEAIATLDWLIEEMEHRYKVLRENKVGNLIDLNQKEDATVKLPFIWVIHDEFAEWMMTDEYKNAVSNTVGRLGVKARAAGIFLIFAAQRPDNNVMPMQLRSQLGNRFVLRVDGAGTSEISLGEKNCV